MLLKYRIALIIFLLQSLIMAVIFWNTTRLLQENHEIQFGVNTRVVLQLFSKLTTQADFYEEYSELQGYAEELSQNPYIEEILVVDNRGLVQVSNNFLLIGTKRLSINPHADPLWRKQAIHSKATLWIHFSDETFQKYTDQAWKETLWIAIIGLLIIALVGLLIGNWLIQRLAHLNTSAKLFAQGHYKSRSPLSGKDEITSLSQSFNHMAKITEKNINALRSSNEELEHFAYIASHDLQTPLRSIRLFSDMLEEDLGDQLNDSEKDYLHRIQQAAQRMSQLLQALLDYSRIQHTETVLKEVNLNQQMENIKHDLTATILETQATLEIDELPTVKTDEYKSHQLFLNLLSNALKYHRENHPPHIQISTTVQTHQYLITVSDNGIGFDMTYKNKIFKPFKRLHDQKHYTGTGIGLATCQRIIEALGWNISVTSTPNKGSQFTVVIPYQPEDTVEDETSTR
jgi:signal transduction histidine kinase